MKTIFVSGASTVIGYGILRSLRQSNIELRLIGSSIYEDTIANEFCDIFIKAPLTSDDGYINWLVRIITDFNIDLVIPSFDPDVYKWSDNFETLKNTGVIIMLNNLKLISLCRDKWLMYEKLKNEKCSCIIPTSLSREYNKLLDDFGLPMIFKPRQGTGSKGVVKISKKQDLKKHMKTIDDSILVQPLIGKDDEEYTTSAFCDGFGGYYSIITLKRKLSKQGITGNAQVIKVEQIEKNVEELCQLLKPVGPTNFQFRKHNEKFYLLEINPRISSATSIRNAFGFNESEMVLEYYLENKNPIQPEIRSGKAIRYIEDYIIYT